MPYRNGVYYNAAYTYEEAKKYLNLYKKALIALVDGQAKEYTIGGRSVTLLDHDDLMKNVSRFADIVSKYETNTIPARSRSVVFRDT